MHTIILASSSPQRKALLEGLGVDFTVLPSNLDESSCQEKDPAKRAIALAHLKAEDIAALQHANSNNASYIIGCDTLVVADDGTVLEKPSNDQEARAMISMYSGSYCTVHSGLCVIAPNGDEALDICSSKVFFKELTDQEIDWWIGTNLWQGRSGGFQIDGLGQMMIERIEGDWTSIVGLPVFLLGSMMQELGVNWLKNNNL